MPNTAVPTENEENISENEQFEENSQNYNAESGIRHPIYEERYEGRDASEIEDLNTNSKLKKGDLRAIEELIHRYDASDDNQEDERRVKRSRFLFIM